MRAEFTLREDNILEIDSKATGEFFQINLNTVSIILLVKNENTISFNINGIRSIETLPLTYYEGLEQILKESKLFEVEVENYYTIVTDSKKEERGKQHIDNVFVNINSKDILMVTEEPAYTEDDTEKLRVDVIDKGSLIFYKEKEENG